MAHIDDIIKQMGYAESSCLKYKRDKFDGAVFSAHELKVLNELSPYAVYLVDGNPFVIFFEEIVGDDDNQQLSKRIWNSQIPIVVICGIGNVKIFNGCSIDKNKCLLEQVACLNSNEMILRKSLEMYTMFRLRLN